MFTRARYTSTMGRRRSRAFSVTRDPGKTTVGNLRRRTQGSSTTPIGPSGGDGPGQWLPQVVVLIHCQPKVVKLPTDHMPTFGFETARHFGTELVRNLMEDARTTNRWYLVTAMGRKAGHLTLGIGKSSGQL